MNLSNGEVTEPKNVTVLGAGSWGTALAHLLAENGHAVTVWDRNIDIVEQIRGYRINALYLSGVQLPESVMAFNSMREAVTPKTDWVVIAVSSSGLRNVTSELAEIISPETAIVSAAKGLEAETALTVTEVIGLILNGVTYGGLVALSGPNLAQEVVRRIPSAAVAASEHPGLARRARNLFMTPHTFRVYTHSDVKGVELGGALKNVLAIGAGISDGLGFGDNTKAALMTRGLMEMSQLGLACGAKALTFLGLAGVGDLMATSASTLSRNYRVGIGLAARKPLPLILSEIGQVAEGINTSAAARILGCRFAVETPLFDTLNDVINGKLSAGIAVDELMSRPAKDEYA